MARMELSENDSDSEPELSSLGSADFIVKVRALIADFFKSSSTVYTFPPNLTVQQRSIVHDLADDSGLETSKSVCISKHMVSLELPIIIALYQLSWWKPVCHKSLMTRMLLWLLLLQESSLHQDVVEVAHQGSKISQKRRSKCKLII